MSMFEFASTHVAQITATSGLVSYALLRNKLTPVGTIAGIFVALVHMLHPWPAFFWLLILFFLFGTLVTRIGHKAKVHLTQSATGGLGGEGARSSAQVFANSGTACILIALHAYLLQSLPYTSSRLPTAPGPHAPALSQLLPIGIIAQYAAVAADTFSSELGILSKTEPFMITTPWRKVPRGTNGGVTIDGLAFGLLGSLLLTIVAAWALYLSSPGIVMHPVTASVLIAAGLVGSIIDSLLGAFTQVTVTDRQSGKVIEGAGGIRVKVLEGGGRVQLGHDLLTNNGVNFAMAGITSVLAMGVSYACGLGIKSG